MKVIVMQDFLKRDRWWFWVLLLLVGGTSFYPIIAGLMIDGVYEKDAWYTTWYYWLIGVLCCFLPAVIMFYVFVIQILTRVCEKLEVPGSEIYTSPYSWLLCLIVPVIGWILFAVMLIYLEIFLIVSIYRGKGEKFVKSE